MRKVASAPTTSVPKDNKAATSGRDSHPAAAPGPVSSEKVADAAIAGNASPHSPHAAGKPESVMPAQKSAPVAGTDSHPTAGDSAQAESPGPQKPVEATGMERSNAPTAGHTPASKIGARSISGASISSLLNTPKSIHDVVAEEGSDESDRRVDPESEGKIAAVRDRFIAILDHKWPRIAIALGTMKVSGNKLSVSVPTRALYEEIMRNRSDVLYMLAETAGIDGVIELAVEVKEDKTASRRPIKAEDKARFLAEQNPALELLRKKLDLDIE